MTTRWSDRADESDMSYEEAITRYHDLERELIQLQPAYNRYMTLSHELIRLQHIIQGREEPKEIIKAERTPKSKAKAPNSSSWVAEFKKLSPEQQAEILKHLK